MSLPPFVLQASTSSSLPSFPSEIKKLSELTDGVGLCALVSLYCPNELPWTEVALGEPPSMADSLYNIQVITSVLLGNVGPKNVKNMSEYHNFYSF